MPSECSVRGCDRPRSTRLSLGGGERPTFEFVVCSAHELELKFADYLVDNRELVIVPRKLSGFTIRHTWNGAVVVTLKTQVDGVDDATFEFAASEEMLGLLRDRIRP